MLATSSFLFSPFSHDGFEKTEAMPKCSSRLLPPSRLLPQGSCQTSERHCRPNMVEPALKGGRNSDSHVEARNSLITNNSMSVGGDRKIGAPDEMDPHRQLPCEVADAGSRREAFNIDAHASERFSWVRFPQSFVLANTFFTCLLIDRCLKCQTGLQHFFHTHPWLSFCDMSLTTFRLQNFCNHWPLSDIS